MRHGLTTNPMLQSLLRPSTLPRAVVSLLLALPWVQPWAPGPETNTIPLLVSWGTLGLLLALGQLPSALDMARAWAWAAVISSLMALPQYFGEAAHLGGWVQVPGNLGEAFGNLRQRNQLATHLGIGMAAVLWWHRQGLRTVHALWMLALMAVATAATSSRTGLLQMMVLPALLGTWTWVQNRQSGFLQRPPVPSWRLALYALGLYLLASGVLPQLLRWHNGADALSALVRMGESYGCGSRKVLWANVLHLIAQKPWLGWGWGELKYAHYMADYSGERFCDILGNAHNLPLQLAVELGVPLALAACVSLLAVLWRAHPWRLQDPNDALAWGVLMPIALHSLLEFPLWYGPFQVAALGATVLLWPAARATFERRRSAFQVLALAGLCLVPPIAWDYQRVRQAYLPPALRSPLWRANPWAAARQTWFFGESLRFAEVTVFPVKPENAQAMLDASLATLHDSPEPRVIDKLIQSARLVGREDLAHWHEQHKQAVYGTSQNNSASTTR